MGLQRHAVVIGALSSLLGACASSPPTHFYTLSDTAPEGTPPADVGPVTIGAVNIPGELDRAQIVRRTGPNQLKIEELDRWAAPLDDTIRRVLSDDMARRVPLSAAASGSPRQVSVDIREFYGDADCNVTLRAGWTPKVPQGTAPLQLPPEEIKVPSSGACPVTLAATMSIALGQLSDRIVAGVARLPPPAAAKK